MNYHILGSKNPNFQKHAVWEEILNMKYRAFKKQKPDHPLYFHGTMLTDGVNVTISKQHFEPGRRQMNSISNNATNFKNPRSKKPEHDDQEFKYIEDLTQEKLKEIKGKCELVDPGRCDILYCMKETSTTQNRQDLGDMRVL